MATYNVHAGHGVAGKGTVGAIGLLNESIEDRKVKDVVIKYLRQAGHTVYDCTVDNGTANEILSAIVKKCNAHTVDLDVSIHFNAGANKPTKDGKTTGTEVYCYNSSSTKAVQAAQRICSNIAALGFKNRGVKYNTGLYVLKNTKAQALLVECCFVDDGDDAAIYNAESMGKAIADGILGTKIVATAATATTLNVTQPAVYPKYTGNSPSITAALMAVGEKDTSYAHRSKIAVANNITGYKGTAQQNTSMVAFLKQGKLKKA